MFTSLAYIFPTAPSLETKSFCSPLFLILCLPQAGERVNFGTVAMKRSRFSKNFFPTNIVPLCHLERENKINEEFQNLNLYRGMLSLPLTSVKMLDFDYSVIK